MKTTLLDMEGKYLAAACASILAGMVILGVSAVSAVRTNRSYDRFVTVRGLSEKEVMADRVIWPITYKQGGNNLQSLYGEVNRKNQEIVAFLKNAGITDDEISIAAPKILDTKTETYVENTIYDYIVTSVITVCSQKVDTVLRLQSDQMELLSKGIAVGTANSWEYSTEYSFNGLNEIKPEMIEEATKNARQAALKFAADSDSRLGKIKNATQGQFTITQRDSNTPYVMNVRVVTNVVYYLKD